MLKTLTIDLVILIAVLLVAGAVWSSADHTDASPRAVASYTCADGKTITASYYEGESQPAASPDEPPVPGGSVRVVFSDGRDMTLPQTISASGIRYANADESLVFWSKGNGAFVIENGEQTYSDCVQQ